MATKGSKIVTRVQEILRDDTGVLYKDPEAIEWINEAQQAITYKRPDSKASTESLQLVVGTKQALPATARRLMGMVRNLGSDGLTIGRAIRGPVPMTDLDGFDASWHTKTGTAVREYVYRKELPRVFYVSPGASSTFYIEVELSLYSADITALTDNIDLEDIYVPAITEWLLYRFFCRDDERTPNYVRAGRHFANFFTILGVKTDADMAIAPEILEYT